MLQFHSVTDEAVLFDGGNIGDFANMDPDNPACKSVLCTLKYKFSQLSQHEHGESHDMQAFERLGQTFVVTREAAETGQPGERALDDPAARQQDEAAFGLRQFDDLQRRAT